MVRFDQMRVFAAGRLDHIGIDCSLCEPVRSGQLASLFFKDFDKDTTNDLSLLFRVVDTGEFVEKTLLGIHADDLDAHVLGEHGHDLVAFTITQQSIVDKHAGQLIADRAMQQCRNHR